MFKRLLKSIVPQHTVSAFRVWRRRRVLQNKRLPRSLIGKIKPSWRNRINDVLACPDNAFIPRVPTAGTIDGNMITMHNGIKINALSYYGAGMLNMLVENKGVHEPQEERAFAEVIQYLPAKPVMLELGAYWGFYSLWLKISKKDASCHLVEPEEANLFAGRLNFEMNGLSAEFETAFVSDRDEQSGQGPRTISVDGYYRRKNIGHLHLLHSDIQGHEADMLNGARELFTQRKVDYVFISTHSQELHYRCRDQLRDYGYDILCSVDMKESYSCDGLIVAKSPLIAASVHLEVSKKPAVV